MISVVIKVEGLADIRKLLQGDPQNQAEAMIKAQVKAATLATTKLKQGLRKYGGDYGSKDYKTSAKGELPLRHSGQLESSIFFKNIAHKTTVETQFGSVLNTPYYAIYLEGKKGDGIRPFLWYAEDIFNVEKVLEYFDKYYKPLQGAK